MTMPARSENRADVRRAPRPIVRRGQGLPIAKPADAGRRADVPTAELASRVCAAFRAHPHINNVLTHISRADWSAVTRALSAIFDPGVTSDGRSALERNILDLMCAERGITGRILKPYFHARLHRLLEPHEAERLIRHVQALFLELEWKAQQPARSPAPSKSSQEADMSEPSSEPDRSERVINVADIDPRYRHDILFALFEHLAPDASLQIVVDHDPRRLRLQLEARHGARCGWSYLEQGPDVWRVRLRLLGPGAAAAE